MTPCPTTDIATNWANTFKAALMNNLMKVLLSYVLQFSKQYALMSCIPITVHESRNVIYAIIHTCVCYYVRNSVEVVRSQLFTAVVRICKEFFINWIWSQLAI